jgi:putative DNA primase/helicase
MSAPDDAARIPPNRTKESAPGGEAANAIRFETPAARDGGGAHPRATRRRTAKDSVPPAPAAPPDERRTALPDAVQERFIRVGNQFYFPDGAEAFTDHGERLSTRSENTVVIQAMVAIAEARGAREVQLTGSEFFRKEAWFAAKLAGLEVRGYEPSALEQERVVRAIGRRDPATQPTPEREVNAVRASEPARGGGPAPTPPRNAPDSELIVGRLVEHGPAHYHHRPNQPLSYYVRIETEHGEIERWGVDLERAFRQSLSRPGIGDQVGLRIVGTDPVTVRASKRGVDGREVGQEERRTHRNQWVLERMDFLEERARMAAIFQDPAVSSAEAIRRHPELDGSYVQLQMGHALAEERFKSKLHREQFVDHLRAYLAREIEQGRSLEPVPLRERRDRPAEPKAHDRDYAPAR